MWGTYLKIAVRNLLKNKVSSFVNFAGLALGLACSLLIGYFVYDELQYDRFHENGDRIYRLGSDLYAPGETTAAPLAACGWPIGHTVAAHYPEVERVTYVRPFNPPLRHDGQYFFEKTLCADSNFLRVFSFPLLEGDAATALRGPQRAVVSRTLAEKLFPGRPALGQTLMLFDTLPVQITGVADKVPARSHVQFDLLVSFESLCAWRFEDCAQFETGWLNVNVYTYALLRPGAGGAGFAEKITDVVRRFAGEQVNGFGYRYDVVAEPLSQLYLHSTRGHGLGPQGAARYVYVLGSVAALLVLIACINFINLTTAQSVQRAREIGLRKCLGSSRPALVRQLLGETFLLTLLAAVVAGLLVWAGADAFESLTGKAVQAGVFLEPGFIAAAVALLLVVPVLAGFYPALVVSRFRPAEVLKGVFSRSLPGLRLRQALVVFQFAV
jgi:putative ABC transport system permease protein